MKKQSFVRIAHPDDCSCPEYPGKTRIPIEVIEQAPTFKSLGIYSYMLSYPKSEVFTLGRIAYYSADGIESVMGGIKTLLKAGWIQEFKIPLNWGWVYLIQSMDTITPRFKIGKSEDPWQRFFELQSVSPSELKLIHLIKCDNIGSLEKHLHRKYDSKRLRFNGIRGEWFELSQQDVNEIKATQGAAL